MVLANVGNSYTSRLRDLGSIVDRTYMSAALVRRVVWWFAPNAFEGDTFFMAAKPTYPLIIRQEKEPPKSTDG